MTNPDRCEYLTVIRGTDLRRLRWDKNLTLGRLAEISGVGKGTLSRLEGSSGVRTKAANVDAIAKALGVHPSMLIDEPDL